MPPDLQIDGSDMHQSVLNKASLDKFSIVMDIPPVLKSVNTRNQRKNDLINLDSVQFSLSNISIPGTSVPSQQVAYGGQTAKVTSQKRDPYAPLKFTFLVDNNFNNYHLFWMWLNVMNDNMYSGMIEYFAQLKGPTNKLEKLYDPEISYRKINFKNDFMDYTTKLTVYGLREYNEPIVKFEFLNAFVTDVGEIGYDYSKSDAVTCPVTMDFNRMEMTLLDYIPTENRKK